MSIDQTAIEINKTDTSKVYVDCLSREYNFKRCHYYFDSYENAQIWCLETMDKFDPDFITILD